MTAAVDFTVLDEGTIVVVTGKNADAKAFLDSLVGDDVQTWAGGVVVGHQYVGDLLYELEAGGYTIGGA